MLREREIRIIKKPSPFFFFKEILHFYYLFYLFVAALGLRC